MRTGPNRSSIDKLLINIDYMLDCSKHHNPFLLAASGYSIVSCSTEARTGVHIFLGAISCVRLRVHGGALQSYAPICGSGHRLQKFQFYNAQWIEMVVGGGQGEIPQPDGYDDYDDQHEPGYMSGSFINDAADLNPEYEQYYDGPIHEEDELFDDDLDIDGGRLVCLRFRSPRSLTYVSTVGSVNQVCTQTSNMLTRARAHHLLPPVLMLTAFCFPIDDRVGLSHVRCTTNPTIRGCQHTRLRTVTLICTTTMAEREGGIMILMIDDVYTSLFV